MLGYPVLWRQSVVSFCCEYCIIFRAARCLFNFPSLNICLEIEPHSTLTVHLH